MIEVSGFKKVFYFGVRRKRTEAARDISFTVEAKEIFGFLGPNGAGKTTTIKALLALIKPDAGTLKLCGHDVRSLAWRNVVGYMPEHPTFYEYLSGFEMVVWFGRLAGLSRHEAEKDATRHLERVGLGHALHRRMRQYSKGMLQRAGLAQALMGSPRLLILDEPMTGLDPLGRRDIRNLLLELRDEGRTIFYSTHILPDVEMTCDRVAVIDHGVTVRTGRLEQILTETTRGVSVIVEGLDEERLARVRHDHPGATYADGALQIELPDADRAREVLKDLIGSGARLVRFEQHRDDLETIFMRSLSNPSTPRDEAKP
jgi:ABC-2 type transport system ATP-binding protein